MKEEKHLDIYGDLREDVRVKTYLHGPMDYAKDTGMKLRFRVGGMDLPGRRKKYTSSREEDVSAHMCACGTTIENITHIRSRRM